MLHQTCRAFSRLLAEIHKTRNDQLYNVKFPNQLYNVKFPNFHGFHMDVTSIERYICISVLVLSLICLFV